MTTVFTADVVKYNLTPEKYAEVVAGVTAEMTIAIECDWQLSLKTWWEAAGAAAVAVKDTWIAAQGPDLDRDDAANILALQEMVYQIGSDSGYYDGNASGDGAYVNLQFKSCLDAVLQATVAQSPTPNALAIDAIKVQDDMKRAADSSLLDAANKVPSANTQTTILGCLLNAHAFASVCDRLIKGGNFKVGSLDNTSTGDHKFQSHVTADGDNSGDYISDGAKLVFPVKITVADDGMTAGEGDNTGQVPGGSGSMTDFQLNLSFCMPGQTNNSDHVLQE